MPTSVKPWVRATSGDDRVGYNPALFELDPTGKVLRRAVAVERGSPGTVSTPTDLLGLLQAAAAAAELRETVATMKCQVHSDEIAAHSLCAAL
jgi:hypothetical protein